MIPFEWDLPLGFPAPEVPQDNPMSYEKIELGRFLFYDTRMSGNQTFSCSSCHQQELAFTDGRTRSVGSTGQTHPRGAMSLANIAWAPTLTWNNNILEQLEEQALVPMFGEFPVELGLSGREAELLARFAAVPLYQRMFEEAFPEETDPISLASIVRAIASFQRTLISGSAPFDKWLFGDDDALSDSAIRGLELILDIDGKTECGHCHAGFNFTTSRVHEGELPLKPFFNTGLYNLRCSTFDLPEVSGTGLGCFPPDNLGLFEVSTFKEHMGQFKPPTLRNICVTAPYMHDGSVDDLDAVIDHYAAGGRTIESGPYAGDGSLNPLKDAFLVGFRLSAQERTDLKEFLCRGLTDEEFLTNPQFSDPFAGPPCAGDCNFNGVVAVNEIIRSINASLNSGTLASCVPADANLSGNVEVHEIIRSINFSLDGCPTP